MYIKVRTSKSAPGLMVIAQANGERKGCAELAKMRVGTNEERLSSRFSRVMVL